MIQSFKTIAPIAAAVIALALVAVPAWSDEAGKAAFSEEKCNKCHSVKTHDIERTVASEKMWGPDLSGVGLRHDAEWMNKYTLKEIEVDGKAHKNTYKGSDDNLAAIIDWLAMQKTDAPD